MRDHHKFIEGIMLQSRIQPYLDVLMQHLSDLMVEAESWPDIAQVHLYAFWSHIDHLTQLLPLPQIPVRESRFYMSEMWQDLAALEQMPFDGAVFAHVDEISSALRHISYIVDEQISSAFELPVIAINTMDTVDWTPVK
jgi:hypothetical protein